MAEDGQAEGLEDGKAGEDQGKHASTARKPTIPVIRSIKRAVHSPIVQEGLVAYACVALWVLLSSAVIVFNKFMLGPFGFSFPLTLTMWHQLFCTVLSFIVVSLSPSIQPLNLSWSTYARKVLPIGVLYAASLWLSNAAYIHLSVAFIQMLKALMPVSVYCVGCICGTESFMWSRYANMAVITAGVALASYGELNFNWLGVSIQLSAVVVEAFRLVLIELLLNRANLKLNANPMLSMYYISPCCLLCLTVPFFSVEYDALVSPYATWVWDSRIFFGNAAVAMALNLAVYLLIGKTSALTMNVASVVKDWVCITSSNFFFYEPTTALQLFGYGIGVAAVSFYNWQKYREKLKAQATASKSEDDA